jgi:peptidoglycan hydrolase CwlO-like protein
LEAAQERCIAELERANAELKTELDQSNDKVQELELQKESLTVGYRQLNQKYKDLENKAEAWH